MKNYNYLENIFNKFPILLDMDYEQYGFDFRFDKMFSEGIITIEEVDSYLSQINLIEFKDYHMFIDQFKSPPIVSFIEIYNLKYWLRRKKIEKLKSRNEEILENIKKNDPRFKDLEIKPECMYIPEEVELMFYSKEELRLKKLQKIKNKIK